MDFAEMRARMVSEQIAARGIHDVRVLDAMREVPRHEFVSSADQQIAYADRALPIDAGQSISQPYIVALMTEALRLPDRHAPDSVQPPVRTRVLEIGTGSGYQAAILSRLADDVISIERHESLATQARERLARLGYHNVKIVVGDGTQGWNDAAPYDGIIV